MPQRKRGCAKVDHNLFVRTTGKLHAGRQRFCTFNTAILLALNTVIGSYLSFTGEKGKFRGLYVLLRKDSHFIEQKNVFHCQTICYFVVVFL